MDPICQSLQSTECRSDHHMICAKILVSYIKLGFRVIRKKQVGWSRRIYVLRKVRKNIYAYTETIVWSEENLLNVSEQNAHSDRPFPVPWGNEDTRDFNNKVSIKNFGAETVLLEWEWAESLKWAFTLLQLISRKTLTRLNKSGGCDLRQSGRHSRRLRRGRCLSLLTLTSEFWRCECPLGF